MKATHYADNKLHMIYVDLVSGEESEYEPEKKKKRVTKTSDKSAKKRVTKKAMSIKKKPLAESAKKKT